MLTKEDVVWAYRLYLDREPESDAAIEHALNINRDRRRLVEWITRSEEYSKKQKPAVESPFWHYHTTFDAIGTIIKYSQNQLLPSPSHVTNFLGVKIRPDFFPNILHARVGTVEPPPIPANWHADIAEWASCLRAVDLAKDRFTMLELGCGWGCWMNNLGIAAKSAGKKINLYGVEADQEHLQYAKLALSDNGISQEEYVLSRGIAGKQGGIALFPRIHSGVDWGGEAVFNPDKEQLKKARESGAYIQIPIIDIKKLLENESKLDLLQVDIQGAELDVLTELFDVLCQKVRYIVIGTHSKQIEAGLFELFLPSNLWKLEMERPAFFNLVDGIPVISVDGVQSYRNTLF